MPASNPFAGYQGVGTRRADGTGRLFPIDTKGGKFRFAWGEQGMRSSIWNIKATPEGDVYIPATTMARELKVSLQSWGPWKTSWVKDNSGRLTMSGQRFLEATGNRRLDHLETSASARTDYPRLVGRCDSPPRRRHGSDRQTGLFWGCGALAGCLAHGRGARDISQRLKRRKQAADLRPRWSEHRRNPTKAVGGTGAE